MQNGCMRTCMHDCMYLCMFACSIFVCMYVCMYVCTHVCMYVCMHVCMYACTYVCTVGYIYIYIHMYVGIVSLSHIVSLRHNLNPATLQLCAFNTVYLNPSTLAAMRLFVFSGVNCTAFRGNVRHGHSKGVSWWRLSPKLQLNQARALLSRGHGSTGMENLHRVGSWGFRWFL